MANKVSPDQLVFAPQEVVALGTETLQELRSHKRSGIPLGIPCLDKLFNPLLPGRIMSIIGRPGCGKTSFAMRHAGYWSTQVPKDENRAIVIVSWEQSIEDLYTYFVAQRTGISLSRMDRGEIDDTEFKAIEGYGVLHAQSSLWFVGFSERIQARRPPMTVDSVASALEAIKNWSGPNSFRLEMVTLDYLQRIPPSRSAESKAVATGAVVDEIKDASLNFSCPWIVCSQAKQEVDKMSPPIPGLDDSEWSNNMGKAADYAISVTRPAVYKQPGEIFDGVALTKEMHEKYMIISVLKQRKGPANWKRWIAFDVTVNKYLGEMATEEIQM